MNKPALFFLGLSSFFILLFFSLATHPFEVPDEQSHYATVHYLASIGDLPVLSRHSDLSLEEEKTEYLFGIMSEGHNRYSYHPEFRIEQSDTAIGPYEVAINSFNTAELRRTFTIHQAAIYPPLYYYLTLPFYSLAQAGNILDRLFASRLASVLLTTLLIVIAYLFGNLAFGSHKYALSLALLVLLFPMTTYVGVGVNSDNLHNLLFAVFLTLCLRLIKHGWETRFTVLTGLVVALDILTKPQAYLMLPIFALAALFRFSPRDWRQQLQQLGVFFLTVLMLAGWYRQPQYLDTGSGIVAQSVTYGGFANFVAFVKHYVALSGPLLVWYWGVFKWFGVVLPRPFWWFANRLVILSALGLGLSFVRGWRSRRLSLDNRLVIFSLLTNLGYLLALLWFDWQFYQQIGRSLGLQARYLLPLLTTQIYLLFYGLTSLSRALKVKEGLRIGLILFFFSLHFGGLYTQLSSYYNFTSWSVLVRELSQYRPILAKGNWWYLWFSLYLAGIITTCTLVLSSLSLPITKKQSSPKH